MCVNVKNLSFELGKCTHYSAVITTAFTGIMSERGQRYNVPYLVTISQEMKWFWRVTGKSTKVSLIRRSLLGCAAIYGGEKPRCIFGMIWWYEHKHYPIALKVKWASDVILTLAFFFFLWLCDPTRVRASSYLRFLDHTQRRTTFGRTPLDERSARRRDLYLTTHDTHNRQISMPPVGFKHTISAGERP
jgi:hypothetical protein